MAAFKSSGAPILCDALTRMTGDPTATCELVSAVPNAQRRRALLQARPAVLPTTLLQLIRGGQAGRAALE